MNDYLYNLALEALNAAHQARRLDECEYRYFIESFQATPNPQAFEVLCLDVINQFRPVAWKKPTKDNRKEI